MNEIYEEYVNQSRDNMKECLIRLDYVRSHPTQQIDKNFGEEYYVKAKFWALLAKKVPNLL